MIFILRSWSWHDLRKKQNSKIIAVFIIAVFNIMKFLVILFIIKKFTEMDVLKKSSYSLSKTFFSLTRL